MTIRSTRFNLFLLAGLAVPLLPGCGGQSGDKSAPGANQVEGTGNAPKDQIKKYEITDLPPVDEPLPRSLDGNRLEVCPPANWKISSQANYLVVFAKGKVSELPRITVAGTDSPFGKDDTTEQNAQALAKNIQRKLEKDGKKVREPTKTVMLAGRVWVRHVLQRSQGGTPCAVQSLQIVRDGRLYTLETTSAAKDDSQASIAAAVNRDDVRLLTYAVAANAKFAKESGGSPSSPATADKPQEQEETKPAVPAAEKPADPQPAEKKTE